jgi:hypothetical protein
MKEYIPLPQTEIGVRPTVLEAAVGTEYEYPIDHSLDLGKRYSNALRQGIRCSGTDYGAKYDQMMEDPRLDHHNIAHARHVKKFGETSLHKFIDYYDTEESPIDIGIFTTPDAEADIFAFQLFPAGHDLTQLEFASYNLEKEKSEKVQEKKGHGVGAAIQVLAFTRMYAEVNGLSYEEAYNVTSAAATMMIRHDEPAEFDRTFGAVKQYKGEAVAGLHGAELLSAFQKDQIYIYDLSPAQLVDIFKLVRGAQDGYGFVSSFETDFESELEAIQAMDTPLIGNISRTRELRLRHLSEIAYSADMKDMICPYSEQITRTLTTQYSKNRPFSLFMTTEDQAPMSVDEAFTHIQGTNGTLDSDDVRLLWEMCHVNGISHDSLLKDVPWEKDFLKEHIIMGALLLRELGSRVMRGDYSVIEQIYDHRLLSLEKRALDLEEKLRASGSESHINGGITLKMNGIKEERDEIIQSARQKHRSYSPQNIASFQELVDRVMTVLKGEYDVSDDELNTYKQKVEDFAPAETLEFHGDAVVSTPLKISVQSAPHFRNIYTAPGLDHSDHIPGHAK